MSNHKRQRRRVWSAAAALTTIASAVALVAGVTYGLYSSKPSAESNSFAAGSVTLTSNVTGACSTTDMAPGDPPAACTLGLTYSGSLTAYLAVDVLIETQAGTGGTDLYNPPSANNGLTVSITDNQTSPVTYTVPTTVTTCPGGAPTGSTCYELDNELLGTGTYANGATDTISTTVTLPLAAGNGYQGGAAQVILTAHAVQSKNNTLHCTATPTAGQSCTAASGFAWS